VRLHFQKREEVDFGTLLPKFLDFMRIGGMRATSSAPVTYRQSILNKGVMRRVLGTYG
jgi:hypothetical protein